VDFHTLALVEHEVLEFSWNRHFGLLAVEEVESHTRVNIVLLKFNFLVDEVRNFPESTSLNLYWLLWSWFFWVSCYNLFDWLWLLFLSFSFFSFNSDLTIKESFIL